MSSEIESTFREWTRLNLCLEIHQLRADNARLREELEQQSLYTKHVEAELSQLRGSEPCDECGVDTVKLLDERDKLHAEKASLESVVKNDCEIEELCRVEAKFVLPTTKVDGDSHGVPTIADVMARLVDEIKKSREVVKACEVALEWLHGHFTSGDLAYMASKRHALKVNDDALSLIHTLQSGEKKEGSK